MNGRKSGGEEAETHIVLQERGPRLVRVEDFEHLDPRLGEELLGVPAVCDGLPLLGVVEPDVPQSLVGNVLDKDPSQSEHALPLVLRPHRRRRVVVDLGKH